MFAEAFDKLGHEDNEDINELAVPSHWLGFCVLADMYTVALLVAGECGKLQNRCSSAQR